MCETFQLTDSRIVSFFNDPATTEIYTLSLHDALPICSPCSASASSNGRGPRKPGPGADGARPDPAPPPRPPKGRRPRPVRGHPRATPRRGADEPPVLGRG